MISKYLLLGILLCSFFGCNKQKERNVSHSRPGKNEMTDLNRYLVQKDRERIESYAERKNLKMTESPTGLWYLIIKEGTGNFFAGNDRVILEYDCSLLDGTMCYSSENLGPKEVILGKSELEPGLYEGLRMLRPGGEAIFIIPPFLAYGLVGDGKKIPSRSVVVYKVKAVQTKSKQME